MSTTQPTPFGTQQALTIHAHSLVFGGGTFRRGRPIMAGYAVSVRTFTIERELTVVAIEDALSQLTDLDTIGTWYEPSADAWEISKVHVFYTPGPALIVARRIGERFVYDLGREVCLSARPLAA